MLRSSSSDPYRPAAAAEETALARVPLAEEVERLYITRVLQAAGGNESLAAQRLGVSRRTLYRKLGEYGAE